MSFPIGTRIRNRITEELGTVTGPPSSHYFGYFPLVWDETAPDVYWSDGKRLEVVEEQLTECEGDPLLKRVA